MSRPSQEYCSYLRLNNTICSHMTRKRNRIAQSVLRWSLSVIVAFYGFCTVSLSYVRFFPPPFTSVQVQRRIEALFVPGPYEQRYAFVPRSQIANPLAYAAVASEDSRFFQHHGIDWVELHLALKGAWQRGRLGRGASTITQQLVKNLLLTTYGSVFRKGVEFTLAPLAELILPKARILELYLNVVEWGPGVFGAEAAGRYHYGVSAADLSRSQAARLVACLPAPHARTPQEMSALSADILARMRRMGW
jgi:monofunctional biosynthetic peptidoglycan transglycosylase